MSLSVYLTMMLCFTVGLCEGRKVMNGRYTRDISKFELLVPHKVDQSGSFLSFHLPHFFHHNFAAHRLKRDFNHHEAIHYKLHFDGHDHVVELLPNHGFISPSMVHETHFKGSGKTLQGRRINMKSPLMCHYTGRVQNIDESRAALSTCDGLTGYVETTSGKYLIEPVDEQMANEDGHFLHVIHKVDNPTDNFCGTKQWENGWRSANKYHNHHQPHLRVKRSEVKHRFMKVVIVADKTFLNHHKNDDPERYILTVMNMVSDYFHDSSTGQIIDVVIVRIISLEEQKPMEFEISKNATQTLTSFCKWQNEQNPKDHQSQHHHDTALLLTRHDICSDESCHLLGLANVATICVPEDSCAINEDNGLMLGVTITHEIGHLLGCDHDDGRECRAEDEHKLNTVMAPQVKLATGQWSKCSKRFIQELIDDKLGECMNDEPIESDYKLDKSLLPGTIYDADFQCRMLFGKNVKVCQWNVETICGRLLCQIEDKCRTNGEPAADGTSCGSNKWCIKKECVRVGKRRDDAIAGGWSEWGQWSACNRHCGSGIQYSERDCISPTPKNGGRYCLGERKRYQVCNIKPCTSSSSFRQQQCESFNDKKHQWSSYLKASESCVLFCINEKNVVHRKSQKVKDGTPCKLGGNDMCIAAECKNVGCDWVLNSHKIDDQCGICNGNGKSCKIVNGTLEFNDEDSKKFISIPFNARSIVVRKLAPSSSRIQLTNPKTKANFLQVYDAGELDLDDEIALLELPEKGREEVFISGPTSKAFKLHVDYKKGNPVKVFYQFSSPNELVETKLESASSEKVGGFIWDFLAPNGKCDVRCGSGTQQIPAVCVSKEGEQPDDLCDQPKPPLRTKPCNTHPCSYKWQIGRWSACSQCQHKGGQQERTIWCGHEPRHWDEKPPRADDDKCSDSDGLKPPIKRLCSAECSRKCNGKRFTRAAQYFVELYKNLNVFVLEPDFYVSDHAEVQNEAIPGTEDEKTRGKHFASKTSVKPKFIVNPMLIRHHRKLRELQNLRKSKKVKFVFDKSPDSGKFFEMPITNEKQVLSDEVFRKLGDKLERTLDIKHGRIVQAAEAHKTTEKSV